MAGLTPNELQNILGRAAKLCNPQGDKLVAANTDQSHFTRQLDESYDVPSVEDYDDAEQWDSLYSDNADEDYAAARAAGYSKASLAKSAIPENIKKSMMENPIDVSSLDTTSVLDQMGIKPQRITAAMQKRAQINEGRQSGAPQASAGIDYSLIKTIVSQCVNDALANRSQDGTLSQIYLKGGNITLVDNKGNIYRAKLELIGNKNDKK